MKQLFYLIASLAIFAFIPSSALGQISFGSGNSYAPKTYSSPGGGAYSKPSGYGTKKYGVAKPSNFHNNNTIKSPTASSKSKAKAYENLSKNSNNYHDKIKYQKKASNLHHDMLQDGNNKKRAKAKSKFSASHYKKGKNSKSSRGIASNAIRKANSKKNRAKQATIKAKQSAKKRNASRAKAASNKRSAQKSKINAQAKRAQASKAAKSNRKPATKARKASPKKKTASKARKSSPKKASKRKSPPKRSAPKRAKKRR